MVILAIMAIVFVKIIEKYNKQYREKDMRYIKATDAKNNFASAIDIALVEPLVVQRNGRDVVAMVSMEDYELIHQAKVKKFQLLCDEVGKKAQSLGMTEEILEDILNEDEADEI